MEDDSNKANEYKADLQRIHLWSYFELHANQRITLFRYYTIILGLFITSAGVILIRYHQQSSMEEVTGIILSIVFFILTVSFYLLDQRNRQLIHYAEKSLREFENECLKNNIFTKESCVFSKEQDDKRDGKSCIGHSKCFLIIYCASSLVALSLLLFSTWSLGYYSRYGIENSQLTNGTCCDTCCNDLLP